MNFDEWWEKNTRSFLHNEGIAKMTARAGWEAGVTEGLRRAQVARSDTTQGGGSQTPAPVACRWPECGCRADLGEAWKVCSTKGA
jgi:hypothetical protein